MTFWPGFNGKIIRNFMLSREILQFSNSEYIANAMEAIQNLVFGTFDNNSGVAIRTTMPTIKLCGL